MFGLMNSNTPQGLFEKGVKSMSGSVPTVPMARDCNSALTIQYPSTALHNRTQKQHRRAGAKSV